MYWRTANKVLLIVAFFYSTTVDTYLWYYHDRAAATLYDVLYCCIQCSARYRLYFCSWTSHLLLPEHIQHTGGIAESRAAIHCVTTWWHRALRVLVGNDRALSARVGNVAPVCFRLQYIHHILCVRELGDSRNSLYMQYVLAWLACFYLDSEEEQKKDETSPEQRNFCLTASCARRWPLL